MGGTGFDGVTSHELDFLVGKIPGRRNEKPRAFLGRGVQVLLPGLFVGLLCLHVPEPRAFKDGNKGNNYEYEGGKHQAIRDRRAGRRDREGLRVVAALRHGTEKTTRSESVSTVALETGRISDHRLSEQRSVA